MMRYNGMMHNGEVFLWHHEDFPEHTYGFRLYADDDPEALKKAIDLEYPIAKSFTMWRKNDS